MYFLCFALFATSVLTECAPQGATEIDFSQPVSPADYQKVIKQGFATNYFKDRNSPARKYRAQNIQDIYDKGFRNVRLRTKADLPYITPPYDDDNFELFLTRLSEVVDRCIEVGVAPIICWEHHEAEANATEEERQNYLNWWGKVAKKLKDKNYFLSFNLFTELGVDICKDACQDSLRVNTEKYNNWTAEVVRTIRASGGNNAERILILGAPKKTSDDLDVIERSIYENDPYMMIEWHFYAAGPNKRNLTNGLRESLRYWSGNGSTAQRQNLKNFIQKAKDFTSSSGLRSYFGAWMPRDNIEAALNQEEVINFAHYFVSELKKEEIPWSLNVLDNYYETRKSRWITEIQELGRYSLKVSLNMSLVLEAIQSEL